MRHFTVIGMKLVFSIVLPILPFVEAFHPSAEENLQWSYVATAMASDYLQKQ